MTEKILITGIGMITPYGNGIDAVFQGIANRQLGYGPISEMDVSTLPIKVGGYIPAAKAEVTGLPHNKLKGMGKYVKLGILAAKSAVEDAKIDLKSIPAGRIGAFVSSGTHGHNAEGLFGAFDVSRNSENRFDLKLLSSDGVDRVHPWWLLTTISNNLIFFITHFLGIKGANTNTCNSSVGGAYALDRAIESMRSGEIDIALVGGADSPLNWQMLSDLSLLKFLAEGDPGALLPMQPFTAAARGTVLSDAAAFLICETESRARERNVKAYAEVDSTALFGKFQEMVSPSSDGQETATVLSRLFENVPAGGETLVNASATCIEDWDKAELTGLRNCLTGKKAHVGSAKPWIGHTLSASFLLETAISAVALRRQIGLPLPAGSPANSTGVTWSTPGHLKYAHAINLGQCFGGNTAGVLLNGL